jgi:hypothetical protein
MAGGLVYFMTNRRDGVLRRRRYEQFVASRLPQSAYDQSLPNSTPAIHTAFYSIRLRLLGPLNARALEMIVFAF